MTRKAPTPFIPDQWPQVVPDPAPAGGKMLSEIIAQQDWHMPEAAPRRAEDPGLAKPLDNHRKWKLAELAEAVYACLKQRGELAGETAEGFRRRIAVAACGRRISQASHGDFKLIQAAFLRLKGQDRRAAQAEAAAARSGEDIALWHLRKDLAEGGLTESYAEGIARRVYKRPLASLKAKELWTVIFTVRNNNNAAAGKGRAGNRFKSLKARRAAGRRGEPSAKSLEPPTHHARCPDTHPTHATHTHAHPH